MWLLRRDAPQLLRPYRAPRGTIQLGLLAALVWGLTCLLGFQQFGLPTVMVGLHAVLFGRRAVCTPAPSDRRRAGLPGVTASLHLKLTGAMLLVMALDGAGYLLAVDHVDHEQAALVAALEDIFVAVALLTVSVGLVLPGMIAHAAEEVARAADRLATGTLADLVRAIQALGVGDLDAAHARVDVVPVVVHTRDELGAMAASFNIMQDNVAQRRARPGRRARGAPPRPQRPRGQPRDAAGERGAQSARAAGSQHGHMGLGRCHAMCTPGRSRPKRYSAWRRAPSTARSPPFTRTVHPDDLAAFETEERAAQAEHRDSLTTYRTVWPDGSVHWIESSGRALYAPTAR